MGESSGIEWCDHTFNPWWGCIKVHTGCKNCYAETFDKRVGGHHWGPNSPRRFIRQGWNDIVKWNKTAFDDFGRRARVFCASMADLFEDFDGAVLDQLGNKVEIPEALSSYQTLRCDGVHVHWDLKSLRRRALVEMERLTSIEWLVLTKRPENVARMVPASWRKDWPENVKIGTSPCDQPTADAAIRHILELSHRWGVNVFLSAEPLLGAIDFTEHPGPDDMGGPYSVLSTGGWIRWVIVGAESGAGARPMDLAHARSIVEQCKDERVPCFVKQLIHNGRKVPFDEWPNDLRVREFPDW